MSNKLLSKFIIGTFVALYLLVSTISTIHVIDFFELSNSRAMSIALAIAFELGAAASLASIVAMDKMNKTLVWSLFIIITLMQMNGNLYYAFVNLQDYQSWSELFNLIEEDLIYQKRIISFVSGAILPLVALGFIKSLVDYIKPTDRSEGSISSTDNNPSQKVNDEEHIEEPKEKQDDSNEQQGLEESTEKQDDLETKEIKKEFMDSWGEELDDVLNNMASELQQSDDVPEGNIEEQYNDKKVRPLLEEDVDGDLALKKALEEKAEEQKKSFLSNKNTES